MSYDEAIEHHEALSCDDLAAAEAIFLAYAPYLRMVVRRRMTARLRLRFDSHDVVQSVWADVLLRLIQKEDGGLRFPDASRLRSFLVRLTVNRFIDYYRRHRTSLGRERPFSPRDEASLTTPCGDCPSEQAQAGELWARMLRITRPAHHEALRLKALGVPLAEIAARTGFHQSSVRRIFYELSERLEEEEPGQRPHPDR